MPMRNMQQGGVAMLDNGDGFPVPLADNDPQRWTYSFVALGVTPAASPTDILTIQGSASKIIKVRSIGLAGSALAATNILPTLIRRSTANGAGASTAPVFAKHDNNDPVATAVATLYSANPASLGNAVATLDGGRLNLAPAANGSIDRLVFQYGWFNEKPIVLRGVNDWLCLNLGGAAIANTPLLDISVIITEE